jgi:hypothetical protein
MPNEDEREQALQQAARLKGFTLVRAGDAFALAVYTAATLDEIAEFLATDLPADTPHRRGEEQRLADMWAMLRTERALIAELEEEKRKSASEAPNTRRSRPHWRRFAAGSLRSRTPGEHRIDVTGPRP